MCRISLLPLAETTIETVHFIKPGLLEKTGGALAADAVVTTDDEWFGLVGLGHKRLQVALVDLLRVGDVCVCETFRVSNVGNGDAGVLHHVESRGSGNSRYHGDVLSLDGVEKIFVGLPISMQ